MRYSGTGKKFKLHLFKKSSFDCDIEYSELKKLKRLAVGSFGIVYSVQWNKGKENEQIAAAKFIKYAETQQFERDFGREINSLRHSKDCKEHIIQFFGLSQGKRIEGMPLSYSSIYEKCWDKDPAFRPKLTQVLNDLDKILDDLENLRPIPKYQEDIDNLLTESTYYYNNTSMQTDEVTIESFGKKHINIPEIFIQNEDGTHQIINSIPTSNLERSISLNTFLQPFKEAHQLFEDTRKSCENVQINKKICKVLLQCINLAEYNFIQAIQHNFKADMFKNIEEITIRLTKQSSFTDELFNKLVKSVNEIKYDKKASKNRKWDSANIIKFYGIVKNENICNGLVFLKAVNILHRDIRSENIIIANNHKAKISNFDHSQLTSDASWNLHIDRNNIEYLAPEILARKNYYFSYDFRCEVYSFGILLWELSNAKTPYENYNNEFGTLKNMILRDKNYNLSNSINSCMLQEYKDIVIQVLYSLANNDRQKNSHNDYLRISSNIFSQSISFFEFSSIEDAINETKKLGGDKLRAWKYFDTHSNLDVPLACYWKGHFLYNNILGEPESKSNERIKEAAQLFKVASEANIGDAQYRYAECLWEGEGVKKDQKLAVEIFRKAADNGNVNAKYRLGKIYYECLSGTEDKEEGAYYLKLAAYENHEAREYCIKCNIDLNDF
ncbi:20978_t:CDS:2 [Gigaspora margarita]|uniref:20978_t:CDS:1 n=1 Tax=Gigaspora margarita TaxID=4874 RepID=A0ABN7UH58_GIGMA|nr:20978_t:CDS:2 [Gigaspora margarita]